MSKKGLSLDDLVDLYSIGRLGSKENNSKFNICYPSEESEDLFKRRSLELFQFPDEKKIRESNYIIDLNKNIC